MKQRSVLSHINRRVVMIKIKKPGIKFDKTISWIYTNTYPRAAAYRLKKGK